ncbi:MAG: N-glycosylase/DNA lyase, partial [Bacteroidetes bacterium]|nr:N-glycosylase/DNA lyase [Bacteroidota bacterium]
MKEIIDTYHQIIKDIHNRIFDFKSVWNEANEKRLFQELAFCLLTPQSKAENAWKTIIKLTENNKLFEANTSSISDDLNLVRFRNNKASYLVEAREIFFNNPKGIRETLSEFTSVSEKRKWLNNNIKGYGLKESSHFLRNIGFVEDIAILDRHILKNLKKFNVINQIPKSIPEKKYFQIESQMKKFSNEIKIP